MICFYLIWCFGYFLALAWISCYWPSKSSNIPLSPVQPARISVVIPFRNESRLVSHLIPELHKIRHRVHEILLVDDQSEDDSFEKFNLAAEEVPNLKVLKSTGLGKKAALSKGILEAVGDIILTSDADCKFPETWASEMIRQFENPSVQLVAGPVITEDSKRSLFNGFQQIEWASILLLTQFFFEKGNPLMCSGANLAFRKSAFDQVHGYSGNEKFLSGDDEFLLKKIHQHFGPDSSRYLPIRNALVKTEPQQTWGALLNQRVRWAGKWKLHRSFSHGLVAVFSFVAQLIWIGSVFFLLVGEISILAFLGIWLVKIVAEGIAFRKVLKSLKLSFSWPDLLATSVIHPFYVLAVGIGTIQGKFNWKGRSN